jgi:hypothetical protein
MSIKQFSAHWSAAQDRIALRFNTPNNEEYRLWFTRAIVKSLFEQSGEHTKNFLSQKHDQSVIPLIQDFQKQKVDSHINAGAGFISGTKTPLGDAPVLAMRLSLTIKRKGLLILTIHLVSRQKIDIPLNFEALQSLVYLIDKLQVEAGWSLSPHGKSLTESSVLSAHLQKPTNKDSFH